MNSSPQDNNTNKETDWSYIKSTVIRPLEVYKGSALEKALTLEQDKYDIIKFDCPVLGDLFISDSGQHILACTVHDCTGNMPRFIVEKRKSLPSWTITQTEQEPRILKFGESGIDSDSIKKLIDKSGEVIITLQDGTWHFKYFPIKIIQNNLEDL